MWSPQSESNRWPHPYHGCALPTELWGLTCNYLVRGGFPKHEIHFSISILICKDIYEHLNYCKIQVCSVGNHGNSTVYLSFCENNWYNRDAGCFSNIVYIYTLALKYIFLVSVHGIKRGWLFHLIITKKLLSTLNNCTCHKKSKRGYCCFDNSLLQGHYLIWFGGLGLENIRKQKVANFCWALYFHRNNISDSSCSCYS